MEPSGAHGQHSPRFAMSAKMACCPRVRACIGVTPMSNRSRMLSIISSCGDLRFSIKVSSSVSGLRSGQIGYRRSTCFALIEPYSFMFKRSVISHEKPIGLPRSKAPDKNIWLFVSRNLEHFCHRYPAHRCAGFRSRLIKIVLIFAKRGRLPTALSAIALGSPTSLMGHGRTRQQLRRSILFPPFLLKVENPRHRIV
jgi:hypothetical protein